MLYAALKNTIKPIIIANLTLAPHNEGTIANSPIKFKVGGQAILIQQNKNHSKLTLGAICRNPFI